jgi:hypothetical protein
MPLGRVDNGKPKFVFCNEPAVQFHSLAVKKAKIRVPQEGASS